MKKRPGKKSKSNVLAFTKDPNTVIEKQAERIDKLETWLLKLLVRDEDKRNSDIEKEINMLSKVSVSNLPIYVLNTYNTEFFINECDTQYKKDLAQAVVDYVKLFYPKYTSHLLSEVAEGESKYAANYIFKV